MYRCLVYSCDSIRTCASTVGSLFIIKWDSPTFTVVVPPSHFYPLLSHLQSTSNNHRVAKKDIILRRESGADIDPETRGGGGSRNGKTA